MMPKHEKLVLQISAKKQDERDTISDRKKGEERKSSPFVRGISNFHPKKSEITDFCSTIFGVTHVNSFSLLLLQIGKVLQGSVLRIARHRQIAINF